MIDRCAAGDTYLRDGDDWKQVATDPKIAPAPRTLHTLIEKVANRAHRVTDEDVAALRATGLSEDQIFEIVICAAVGQALAARCFTAKSHISALVVSLEERGWLLRERDPADGRARCLRLTATGRTMAERSMAVQAGIVKAMGEAVDADEMAVVERTMLRVSEQLRVLLTSGYALEALAERGRLPVGAVVLNKPYRKAELARRVRGALIPE